MPVAQLHIHGWSTSKLGAHHTRQVHVHDWSETPRTGAHHRGGCKSMTRALPLVHPIMEPFFNMALKAKSKANDDAGAVRAAKTGIVMRVVAVEGWSIKTTFITFVQDMCFVEKAELKRQYLKGMAQLSQVSPVRK
eukprot:1017684-Pelagomonas_calceolata.AAC.12